VTEADEPSKLVQVLRTVIGDADQKGISVFLHFDKPQASDIRQGSKNLDLNKLMQNVGGEQFDFGTFKAAYDTDSRVKTMVANFNKKGIVPKTAKENPTDAPQSDNQQGGNSVNQMAKRATNVGSDL
jgi:hypothetical protein